jgi:hypothetical protein
MSSLNFRRSLIMKKYIITLSEEAGVLTNFASVSQNIIL